MLQIYTLFETETAQKPYQFGAARTYSYIAYIGEYPPPPPRGIGSPNFTTKYIIYELVISLLLLEHFSGVVRIASVLGAGKRGFVCCSLDGLPPGDCPLAAVFTHLNHEFT